MSDTPRTDAAEYESQDEPVAKLGSVDVDLARTLERELNAANERIKRLEEALNGTVNWIVKLADSGDAGFWDAEEVSEIISARAALKAKEANP
jgi:hypothetical protein